MISVPEIKILILTVYFITFSVVLTTCISLTIEFSNANLYAYFYCQLHGNNSACDELRERYEQSQYPHLTSVITLMTGLITCVNLIFAVRVEDVKEFCSRISRRICPKACT